MDETPDPKTTRQTDLLGGECGATGCLGHYQETSIYDDMDGILHCSECGQPTKRYQQLLDF
jgi:hypothetical protein